MPDTDTRTPGTAKPAGRKSNFGAPRKASASRSIQTSQRTSPPARMRNASAVVEVERRLAKLIRERDVLLERHARAQAEAAYAQQKFSNCELETNKMLQMRRILNPSAPEMAHVSNSVEIPGAPMITYPPVPYNPTGGVPEGVGSIPAPPRNPAPPTPNVADEIKGEGGWK